MFERSAPDSGSHTPGCLSIFYNKEVPEELPYLAPRSGRYLETSSHWMLNEKVNPAFAESSVCDHIAFACWSR